MNQKILISNKLDKEHRSITSLIIGNNKFPLNEKDWLSLISQIQINRPDLIEEYIQDILSPYLDRIAYLQDENDELNSEVDSLRYELEEYETDN